MRFEIRYKPSYSILVVQLDTGENIIAEAGSMTYMQPSIDVKTRKREKGILGTLGMALLGGQSFFVNEFTATTGPGEAAFGSAPLGDIEKLDVTANHGYIIQKSAYVVSEVGVELDVSWQGLYEGTLR